jgi:uncharacterized protein YjiS (DUF1127 family)
MTTTSPVPAADPALHPAPRLKPFAVRRHDMWAHPAPKWPAAHLSSGPIDPKGARSANREQAATGTSSDPSMSWWQLLARFAGWPVRIIAVAWRLQGEIRDVGALDEHLLADMGVTRSELRAALRRSAYPQPVYSAKPGDFGHP